ncbi:MAG: glycoside hydrolase family 9 protein [Butyrivibrio sp.]|nr:glycoside hydrolase family 9 protein [Butyrivibrio sp.]
MIKTRGFSYDTLAAYLAAKKAADYLGNTSRDAVGYKNPGDISTGEYEDNNDVDERFWAYTELFKTTGDSSYEKKAKDELCDSDYALGWQGVAGYGAYAYLTAKSQDEALLKEINDDALKTSELIVANADTYAYGSSIVGDYPWGSNLTIANNGEFLLMMNKAIGEDNKETVEKQIGYLFGNNATGYSFFTGFGTTYTDHPHHRPSQALKKTVPGMVAGGPNNGLNDPYAANVLKGVARAKCYVDNSQSYSTNEVAIYWNSPLVYVLAGEIATCR